MASGLMPIKLVQIDGRSTFAGSIRMRTAIIDLGTNTFHLLISDGLKPLYEERRAVRLGMGGINDGMITPEAIGRAIDCLRDYADLARTHAASQLLAFGTSALRNAKNCEEVCGLISTETGIQVKVISGEEEASLIWEGIRAAMVIGDQPGLIVDIGGGSVEFIVATSERMLWKRSLEIGGQRLIEKFQHHDPILPEEITSVEQYLDQSLGEVREILRGYDPSTLIGSSGSFDTLSEIHCLRTLIPYPSTPETPLTLDSFSSIHQELITRDRAGRMAIPGMIDLRVDMIVVASILIRYLLKVHPFRHIRVSSFSLKEGVRATLA